MKTYITLGFAMLASFGLGAVAVDQLHAQARPPAYVISEIDVTNADGYTKEYVPLATKALAESGQKRLVSGGKTIALAGAPPASRIVLSVFENMEKAQAAYNSPAYLDARKIGDQVPVSCVSLPSKDCHNRRPISRDHPGHAPGQGGQPGQGGLRSWSLGVSRNTHGFGHGQHDGRSYN